MPKKYTADTLKNALEAVNSGTTTYRAAKLYGVPWQTLRDKIKKKYTKQDGAGAPTVLTTAEEELIVKWIQHMASTGFPVTKDLLLHSVTKLIKELNRPNKFKENMPGRHWYEGFLRRHPEVSSRVCQSLTNSRVGANEAKIREWFNKVLRYFSENNFFDVLADPERIFNCDESAFFLCPKGQPVLARKGAKTVYSRSGNDEKENLTLLLGTSAAGKIMPVLSIFPYKRLPQNILSKYPKDWSIGKSESGWMTAETFYEYITNVFHPFLLKENIKRPVALFLDGHVSHLSLHLSEFCQKNDIILIALLPNSTHLLQPMDVAIFRGLKNEWAKHVYSWRMDNNGQRLKREDFGPVLDSAIKKSLNLSTIQNGFRKCGLYPFDENAINYDSLLKNLTNISAVNIQTPPFTSTPNTIRFGTPSSRLIPQNSHVEWFEQSLGFDKLTAFRNSSAEWKGDIKDENLFKFWKQIASGACEIYQPDTDLQQPMSLGDSTFNANTALLTDINFDWPHGVNRMDMVVNEENILEPVKATCETGVVEEVIEQNLELLLSQEHTPSKQQDKIQKTNTSDTQQNSNSKESEVIQNNFPTPFKNALIWPEATNHKTNKPTKKITPTVASSQEFIEYQRRLNEEKKTKRNK